MVEIEVEVEVVEHRVLRVGSLVGAWYSEEVGWGLCTRVGETLSPLVVGSEVRNGAVLGADNFGRH